MKKCIGLFLVFVTLAWNLAGQNKEEKPHFVRILAGQSVPVGVYGKNDVQGARFAQDGFAFSIDGAYFFNRYTSLKISGNFANHAYDAESLEKILIRSGNGDGVIKTSEYKMTSFFLSPYFRLPIRNRFALYGFAGIGVLWAKHPDIKINSSISTLILNGVNEQTVSTFAYEVGIGGKIKLYKGLWFDLQLNRIEGHPEFEFIYDILKQIKGSENRISYVNFLFGLSYQFN